MEKKPLLKERLTEELRATILRLQQQKEHVKIATERELAEEWGVSRISVRAAIKSLTEEGLLVQIQGKGTYVCPKASVRPLYLLCPSEMKTDDPYYSRFLLEVSAACARRSIPFAMVDPEQHAGDRDGILLVMGIPDSGRLSEMIPLYSRVVHLQGGDTVPEAGLRLSFDDRLIGRQAAERLLELGHRRLLHLAGPAKYPSASDRHAGFLERLAEEGLRPEIITGKMNWAGGYTAGEAVLRLLSSLEPPTGIFAANDWMAAGAAQRLKEHGVRIPADLSVIGCDDIPLASDFTPTLATFRLDMKELVDAMLEALQEPHQGTLPGKLQLLPARFITRDSLRNPSL
ncbi:substrate-binding domain-containing protein [Gorillibacterium sp. sgz5001074]|uniref:LacI family DNA-binding transcriptional regulator n=1 Tax=Gorillibacterium sp. sgz5001074 TaxID=3446695 RepID=UPI003F6773C6